MSLYTNNNITLFLWDYETTRPISSLLFMSVESTFYYPTEVRRVFGVWSMPVTKLPPSQNIKTVAL